MKESCAERALQDCYCKNRTRYKSMENQAKKVVRRAIIRETEEQFEELGKYQTLS